MAGIAAIFEEARRRFESFASRDNTPLEKAWVGLGTPSDYRSAVEKGLMQPLHGQATPRALNWWLLTPVGIEHYRKLFPGSEAGEHKYRDGQEIT